MKNIDGNFIAFYLKNLLWAESAPYFQSIIYDIHKEFTTTMSEVVFSHATDILELHVCRDGLIMFRFESFESKRPELEFHPPHPKNRFDKLVDFHYKYIKLANIIQLILFSSIQEEAELFPALPLSITTQDIINLKFMNGEFNGAGYLGNGALAMYLHHGRFLSSYPQSSGYNLDHIHYDHRILSRRGVLKEKVVERCYDKLVFILKDASLFDILNQLSSSISDYTLFNYSQSIVQSWFIIEKFINKHWNDYLFKTNNESEDHNTRINKSRSDFLTGRDFTASIISNILELNSIIDIETLRNIDKIRKRRNVIAHNLGNQNSEPTREECQSAFNIVNYFLNKNYSISINTGYGLSVSGV